MITAPIIPAAGQPGAQEVSAMEAMLQARFPSDYPFLLLPVRIETRFVHAEVPIDQPVLPADLLAHLAEMRGALDDIASHEFATDLAGKGAATRRRLKDVDEAALYAFVDDRLTRAGSAAARLGADAPSCYQGTKADVTALQEAIVTLAPAADRAAASLGRLRSPWHQEHCTKRLSELRRHRLDAGMQALERQTLPALRLYTDGGPAVQRVMNARPGAGATSRGATRAQLARSAVLGENAAEQLARLGQRLDGRAPSADPRTDARAICDGTLQVAALAGEIVALPEERRQTLGVDARSLAGRARSLAAAVETRARLGSADAKDTATLADQLRRAAAALETAVARIPGAAGTLAGLATTRPTRVVNQLRVRVFPDDVFIQTHETELTATEIESGRAFWRETLAAGSNEALKRSAWRALVRKHGSRRAAWIARRLEPTLPHPPLDLGPLLKALELLELRIDEVIKLGPRRLASLAAPIRVVASAIPQRVDVQRGRRVRLSEHLAVLRAKQELLAKAETSARARVAPRLLEQLATLLKRVGAWLEHAEATARRDGEPALAPVYPVLQPKAATWTQSPHSMVLPERFLVVAVTGGRVVHAIAGGPVAPELKLGLDPDPAHEAAERFSVDSDGELQVGDSIRWMADYDQAVTEGMAVSVPISADEAREGFDRLYVLGIKDTTAADAQARIEALLESHHFGQDGFGFLAAGTPTNNTEQGASGFASADDAEASYDLERKGALFSYNPARPQDSADALRFAQALGIRPAAVDNVANAATRAVSESLLANQALWPATVGAYLEDFLGSVIGADAIGRLRTFFVANVVGRGIAPVLRIGDQPYGLLATTAFSRYVPATGAALPPAPDPGAPDVEQKHAARFNLFLREVLEIAHDDWSRIRATRVKHAHSPGITDPQQHFLDMLGQDPTSSSWGYRYAVNIARRQPPPRTGAPGFDFTYPRTATGAITTAADQGPMALLSRFAAVFRAANGLAPDTPLRDPTTGLISAALAPTFDVLVGAGAYGVRYLAAPRRFTGIVVDDRAGSWIPQLLATSMSSLADEARQGQLRSRCLLYVLLRYALLAAQRDATRDILIGDGLQAATWAASGAADHFLVVDLFGESASTKWSWLFQPLGAIDARAGGELPTGVGTLRDHLDQAGNAALERYFSARGANPVFQGSPRRAAHTAAVNLLERHAAAVSALAAIPAQRLDYLVQEHLDLCSHRLDAWRLGLANQRLSELRSRHPLGVHIGAFGWVEDLRPDPPRQPTTSIPPALQRRGETIFEADRNEGFVHTPSLSHAVAAAILRSGYLSETARRDLDNRMAVNLSSRRVRAALDLIDGIGAGSSLSSLLGYRLERFLHEAYASQNITLDDLIYKLRRAFPALAPMDPDAPASTQAERAVVDGLALLGTVRAALDGAGRTVQDGATLFDTLCADGNYTGHPWGVVQHDGSAVLPATSDTDRLDAVLRAFDHIADALDAVGDLALAEAVYQLTRGNHARASAVLAALAEGKPLPRPEIVDTPRSGTMVTHRLFLALPRVDATPLSRSTVADDATLDANRSAAAPAAWSSIPMTPRACAEPSLNLWLGAALGDPVQLVARVVERDSGAEVAVVSVRDLGLQPIDVLALLGPGADAAGGELAARLLAAALPAALDPKAPPALRKVIFEPGAWSVGRTTFLQAAPLCQAVHDLLGKARAAAAADFLDETVKGSAASPAEDRSELEARAHGALAELEIFGTGLASLLSRGQVTSAAALDDAAQFLLDQIGSYRDADGAVVPSLVLAHRPEFAACLQRLSRLGIPGALPPSYYRDDASFARDLLERAEGAFTEAAARRTRAKPVLAVAATSDALVKALRLILGEDAPVVPPFVLRNGDAVKAALAADLLRDAGRRPVERWLHGVAAVRDRTGLLRQALVMADLAGMAPPVPGVAQLPLAVDDRWLGVELPPGALAPTPKLSLVVLGCDALDTSGQPNVAILADEWNEVIPSARETTGIALNADQPDATPPHAMLLVVPPAAPPADGSGRWSLEDLVRSLDETLELARNRLVEPEHLADEIYAQVLPAVAGELIPDAIRDRGAPLGNRVPLDFGAAGHGAG